MNTRKVEENSNFSMIFSYVDGPSPTKHVESNVDIGTLRTPGSVYGNIENSITGNLPVNQNTQPRIRTRSMKDVRPPIRSSLDEATPGLGTPGRLGSETPARGINTPRNQDIWTVAAGRDASNVKMPEPWNRDRDSSPFLSGSTAGSANRGRTPNDNIFSSSKPAPFGYSSTGGGLDGGSAFDSLTPGTGNPNRRGEFPSGEKSGAKLVTLDSRTNPSPFHSNSQYAFSTPLTPSSEYFQPQNRESVRQERNNAPVAAFPTAFDNLESAWLCWILIIGVPANADAVRKIIHKFQEFGDIVDHAVSGGNWVFVKYASPLQAEAAVARNLRLQSENVLVSVQKMNSTLASSLNLRIDLTGSLVNDADSEKMNTPGNTAIPNYSRGVRRRVASSTPVKASVLGLQDDDDDNNNEAMNESTRLQENSRNSSNILGKRTAAGQLGAGFRSRLDPNADDIYLKPAKRPTSICNKIMEFFFSS